MIQKIIKLLRKKERERVIKEVIYEIEFLNTINPMGDAERTYVNRAELYRALKKIKNTP